MTYGELAAKIREGAREEAARLVERYIEEDVWTKEDARRNELLQHVAADIRAMKAWRTSGGED